MKSKPHYRPISLIGLIAILFLVTGCGGRSTKSFFPASTVARDALEASLKHWKSGGPAGKIPGTKVTVIFADVRCTAGKKLESYEVVGEEKSDGPKVFLVTTKLANEKEPSDTRYFVIGIDPLNVISEKDYEKMSGM